MHIVYDCRWIRDAKLDGIGRFTAQLLKALLAQDQSNRYTLLFDRLEMRDWTLGFCGLTTDGRVGTEVIDCPVLSPKEIIVLPAALKRLNAEVVFAPNYLSYPFAKGVKSVLVVHDLIPYLRREVCTTLKWKLFYHFRFHTRFLLNKADHLIVNSECTKSDVATFFGLKPVRMTRVYEGVDAHFFELVSASRQAEVRQKYGLKQDFVLCVSRQQPYKNLKGLAEAYSLLPSALQEKFQLVLTGEAHRLYHDDLAAALQPLQEKGQVKFTGFVADEDLPALYQMATVMVLPSFYEGFGLPVLEAMAGGTAVACSRVASLPEVGGEAAVYFDPHDTENIAKQIGFLLRDPAEREKRRRLGIEQARKFTWERAAGEILRDVLLPLFCKEGIEGS